MNQKDFEDMKNFIAKAFAWVATNVVGGAKQESIAVIAASAADEFSLWQQDRNNGEWFIPAFVENTITRMWPSR